MSRIILDILREGRRRRDPPRILFDPDQPRDEHGRWTSGGDGVMDHPAAAGSGIGGPGGPGEANIGATPFQGAEKSYADAAARWDDPELTETFAEFETKLEAIGMTGTRQIGVFQGNFEPSYSIRVEGDTDAALSAARELGDEYEQQAVSAFDYDPDGPDVEAHLSNIGDPDEFAEAMRSIGVEGGSFPSADTFSTWIDDPDLLVSLVELVGERGVAIDDLKPGRVSW